MNIELNILAKKKELTLTYFLLISIFTIFMILANNIVGFRDLLRLNTNTFPITAGTSLLIHSDWYHFYNNIFLVLILAPVMVNLFGARKSIFLLFGIGYLGHIVELLMVTTINFFLTLIYPLILFTLGYDPFNGDIFVTLRGVGISGGISGWIGIIIYQWMSFFKNRDSLESKGVYYFYWILLFASVLVLSVTDISNFLAYYSPFFFMLIPEDFFVKISISRGTPFLAHLIGIIIGLVIYNEPLIIKFRIIGIWTRNMVNSLKGIL